MGKVGKISHADDRDRKYWIILYFKNGTYGKSLPNREKAFLKVKNNMWEDDTERPIRKSRLQSKPPQMIWSGL
jgi:hypothetical protein